MYFKSGYPKNKEPFHTYDDDGPKKSRGCTDVLCILFFGIFWLFIIYSCSINLMNGDQSNIFRPVDYYGKSSSSLF